MTNTETVSTERLEELLRLEIGERDRYLEGTFLWLKHEDMANAFAELLAVRALETPPLHKEGEAVGYVSAQTLAALRKFAGRRPDTYLHIFGGSRERWNDVPLYAAPVPVTITDELRRAFRNANESDWQHLFAVLPDTHRGWFWKAVMTEARAALSKPGEHG